MRSIFSKALSTFLFLTLFSGVNHRIYATIFSEPDSLFEAHRYTEAQQILDSLYKNGVYSQQSLLKLAYIAEADNSPREALKYLSHYASITQEPEAHEKLRTLAEAHNLAGYELTDFDRFTIYYGQYLGTGVLVLGGLALLTLVIAIIRAFLKKGPSVGLLITSALLIIALTLAIYAQPESIHIVTNYPTQILNAPAAGAEPVTLSEAGDRFTVVQMKDHWVEISIEDKTGFLRRSQVSPIY